MRNKEYVGLKRSTKNAQQLFRGSAFGAAVLVGTLTASVATAAPNQSSPIASIVNDIATVDQNLATLAAEVAGKQENVNKALVDFQNAVAAQQVAVAADKAAQGALAKTRKDVAAAQAEFDAFMRTVNRRGNNMGSMTDYLSSSDPDRVLEQLTSVEQTARQQRATISRLQVVRNQQANKAAATGATRRQAETAAAGADARRADAITAVEAARSAVAAQQGTRDKLVGQRTALMAQLEKLRGKNKVDDQVPGAPAAPAAPAAPGAPAAPAAPGADPAAPAAPGADPAAPAGNNEAMEAAANVARLALETGTQMLAAILGQQQIPHSQLLDELGLGGSMPLGSSGPDSSVERISSGSLGTLFSGSLGTGGGQVQPGLRGPAAVELVVNRAKSQIGLPYAWGGGDANGPTLGIRDGGVADAHGDYSKVGFDCSGLMIYAFAGIGINLPHYTGYQYTFDPAAQVPISAMQRGDMIFYGPNAGTHVAMYLGDGTMIEAPQSGDVVKISPVRTAGAMPNVVRLAA